MVEVDSKLNGKITYTVRFSSLNSVDEEVFHYYESWFDTIEETQAYLKFHNYEGEGVHFELKEGIEPTAKFSKLAYIEEIFEI